MDKEKLLKTALLLKAPGVEAANRYNELADELAAEMNHHMGARKDLDVLIGIGGKAMMEDNHRNHARFIASLFKTFDAAVLIETVLWVFRAYRSHGFQLAYWPAQLDTWVQLLREKLSAEHFKEIEPVYLWMIINQPAFAALSDETSGIGHGVIT